MRSDCDPKGVTHSSLGGIRLHLLTECAIAFKSADEINRLVPMVSGDKIDRRHLDVMPEGKLHNSPNTSFQKALSSRVINPQSNKSKSDGMRIG